MPTEIKQIRDAEARATVLIISGEMLKDDALLASRIASELHAETGDTVTMDLGALDLIDSEAAHVLRRWAEEKHFRLDGVEILVQGAIDGAERAS